MTFTRITSPLLMRFQDKVLPLFAAFVSGATLAWMHTDNENHKKFLKYHHVAIPFLTNHTFYLYAQKPEDVVAVNKEIEGVSAAVAACLPKL